MATVTYKRKEQIVTVDAAKQGTRRILESKGFILQKPALPVAAALPVHVTRALAARYDSPDAVRAASDKELLEIDGIGKATLRSIREHF